MDSATLIKQGWVKQGGMESYIVYRKLTRIAVFGLNGEFLTFQQVPKNCALYEVGGEIWFFPDGKQLRNPEL